MKSAEAEQPSGLWASPEAVGDLLLALDQLGIEVIKVAPVDGVGARLQDAHLQIGDLATGIEARVDDPDAVDPIAIEVERALEYPFYVRHWQNLNQALFSALKLEKIVMNMNEELERSKMALNEQITWQSAIEQSAAAKVLRAQLEQEDAQRKNAAAMKAARLVQLALERPGASSCPS